MHDLRAFFSLIAHSASWAGMFTMTLCHVCLRTGQKSCSVTISAMSGPDCIIKKTIVPWSARHWYKTMQSFWMRLTPCIYAHGLVLAEVWQNLLVILLSSFKFLLVVAIGSRRLLAISDTSLWHQIYCASTASKNEHNAGRRTKIELNLFIISSRTHHSHAQRLSGETLHEYFLRIYEDELPCSVLKQRDCSAWHQTGRVSRKNKQQRADIHVCFGEISRSASRMQCKAYCLNQTTSIDHQLHHQRQGRQNFRQKSEANHQEKRRRCHNKIIVCGSGDAKKMETASESCQQEFIDLGHKLADASAEIIKKHFRYLFWFYFWLWRETRSHHQCLGIVFLSKTLKKSILMSKTKQIGFDHCYSFPWSFSDPWHVCQQALMCFSKFGSCIDHWFEPVIDLLLNLTTTFEKAKYMSSCAPSLCPW